MALGRPGVTFPVPMWKPSPLPVALAGYAAAIAVVLAVAVMGIYALERSAIHMLGAIRSHEHSVTLTERLRWVNEQKIAAGRGYFITGLPSFQQKVEDTSARFRILLGDLRRLETEPRASALLTDIAKATAAYDRVQDEVIALKLRPHDPAELERRFEQSILPRRDVLGTSIERYVAHESALLARTYTVIEKERIRAMVLAVASIIVAGVLAVALVFFVSRRLARMYRREHEAVARAEAALAARHEILAIVAHDLRNPLNAITMKATLIKTLSDPDKLRQQAEAIERVGRRMEKLIKSLLDVSTMEAGRFTVTAKACAVDDIIGEAVELFEGMAGSRSIRLDVAVAQRLAVLADKERILQVLSNLLGNAVKFTPESGVVELSARRAGDAVQFSVSDTGPGLSPEHLPHVFDRFWKQERSGIKGTGLGLYIADNIVKAHGGRMWVESTLGSGAVFHFTLPIPATDSERPAADGASVVPDSRQLHS